MPERMVEKLVLSIYRWLLVLAALAMLGAFGSVLLGIVARLLHWNIPGLDAYAGYAIAAALFLALPATLRQGDHIRVTLVLERLPNRLRAGLELACLLLAGALAGYLAWFALRLVWVSYTTHDVSTAADASPLWIPQIAVAVGSAGFALSFAHALLCRLHGRPFFAAPQADEASHVE
jgi:TRAP-type C4-dicarboxylate transport system permease small subunit